MLLNHKGIVQFVNVNTLKQVENFRYLDSEISSTAKDVSSRIGKAWIALIAKMLLEHCINYIQFGNLPQIYG